MSDVFVGLEVSKAQLDVAVRPGDATWTVAHDEAGIRTLVARLRELQVTLVVVEATSGFEAAVIAALAVAMPVAVVNPRQVRDFAKATGQHARTDRLDALALARFAEGVRPEPRPLSDEETAHLADLLGRRRQLTEMLVAEQHRRTHALDKDLDRGIRNSPVWREKDDLGAR